MTSNFPPAVQAYADYLDGQDATYNPYRPSSIAWSEYDQAMQKLHAQEEQRHAEAIQMY